MIEILNALSELSVYPFSREKNNSTALVELIAHFIGCIVRQRYAKWSKLENRLNESNKIIIFAVSLKTTSKHSNWKLARRENQLSLASTRRCILSLLLKNQTMYILQFQNQLTLNNTFPSPFHHIFPLDFALMTAEWIANWLLDDKICNPFRFTVNAHMLELILCFGESEEQIKYNSNQKLQTHTMRKRRGQRRNVMNKWKIGIWTFLYLYNEQYQIGWHIAKDRAEKIHVSHAAPLIYPSFPFFPFNKIMTII